jgi:histidinol-phosphatase (PHP family)
MVLGSVHFIDGWAFDDPDSVAEWDNRDVDEAWEQYFALWCDAARCGLFDVMAHPDLVKKFGHRPASDPAGLYREAAIAAADGGVLIEVSTAGLRRPVGELYPGPDLLQAFCQAHVGATVGSDAHAPGEVGYAIAKAYSALASAGYEHALFPDGRGGWGSVQL